MPCRRDSLLLVLSSLVVALFARFAMHAASFSLPVSNDDAVLLLMARHILEGELATTLWNQPYNGALDAYLLAPFVGLFGHHLGYRFYQMACAGLLALVAALLARRLGGTLGAGMAAGLAAFGTPYMLEMTAIGPPPNFLMPIVTGVPLLFGLRSLEGRVPPLRRLTAAFLGLVAGLAVWNSSLAIPAFVGGGVGLVLAGLRPRLGNAFAFGGGALVGLSPLLLARLIGASGARVATAASAVTALRPRWLWARGAEETLSALTALVGVEVPLVVDGPERAILPLAVRIALVVGLIVPVALALRLRRALPLLLWAGGLVGAFFLSRRTGPDELRYLYGVNLPLVVLAGVGLASAWRTSRALGVLLGLCILVPWQMGHRLVVAAWSSPEHARRAWEVPPIEEALVALERAGVRSVYASLQFAGRTTLESHGRVIASQAWNERIPGDPLRFRDEVDLDPNAAWMLSSTISRGMPRARLFRVLVDGRATEDLVGGFSVFRGFQPPFDEARSVPKELLSLVTASDREVSSLATDRDPHTAWESPEGISRGSGLVVRVSTARRLDALVLLVDLDESPLGVPWIAQVDGRVVAEGPRRFGLQWVGGVPRAGKQAVLTVLLGGAVGSEVRLSFQGAGPRLRISEAFAYGPDEEPQPRHGAAASARAFEAARVGDWDGAVTGYTEAWRAEPERASLHANWARARWRAGRRRMLDVESLDDGGPEMVVAR